jgi:hypothetical protein
MTTETVDRQIGNYVVCETPEVPATRPGARYGVRMAGDEPGRYISTHPNVTESVQAILRYQAADKRRAR